MPDFLSLNGCIVLGTHLASVLDDLLPGHSTKSTESVSPSWTRKSRTMCGEVD